MTKKEFSNIIKQAAKSQAENWRYGQAIFNYSSELIGVARKVQIFEHIDCVYDDNVVDEFINKAYQYYNK